MITVEEIRRTSEDFNKVEGRAEYYSISRNLITNGYPAEGLLLILATWNINAFRYVQSDFDASAF